MKRIALLLLFMVVLRPSMASSITVSGKVAGTWDVDTVYVAGNLRVNADTLLHILPGTRVVFQGHYELWVLGVIRAMGTVESPILFTVADTLGFSDTLSTSGGWHGIVFNQVSPMADTSFFSHCRFEFGKAIALDSIGVYGGVMRIFNWGKVVVSDCVFFHNLAGKWGGAIYARYADIVVQRSVFRENRCGALTAPYGYGGGFCSVHSMPVLQYNLFEDNASTGIGGGASFEFSDPVLQHNIFRQNYSGLGGAIGYLRSSPVHVASNNLIEGNLAQFFRGGISCIRSNTAFSNNTIVNNQAAYGGGFYANDSAFPAHYNSIFYYNAAAVGQEVYIWDIHSAPDFRYCNVAGGKEDFQGSGGQQGYHGVYENNLDTLPGFTGSGDHPFSLSGQSPMTDRGTPDTAGLQVPAKDLANADRIYNNRIDIGAYEWAPPTGVFPRDDNRARIQVFPNPVRTSLTVSITLEYPESFMIAIHTLEGKPVWHSEIKEFPAGVHHLEIADREVGTAQWKFGVYILRFSGSKTEKSTPFLFIR